MLSLHVPFVAHKCRFLPSGPLSGLTNTVRVSMSRDKQARSGQADAYGRARARTHSLKAASFLIVWIVASCHQAWPSSLIPARRGCSRWSLLTLARSQSARQTAPRGHRGTRRRASEARARRDFAESTSWRCRRGRAAVGPVPRS